VFRGDGIPRWTERPALADHSPPRCRIRIAANVTAGSGTQEKPVPMQLYCLQRREFIALIGGAAAAWPLALRAQQPAKLPTIGFLGSGSPAADTPWTTPFLQRLHELGWVEGRTVAIEYRWGEEIAERYAAMAAEFVRLKVNVI